MRLQLGRFYSSRRGDVWCCFKVDARTRGGNPAAAARCVRLLDDRVETFYVDGRKTATGDDANTLVSEVSFK